MRSIYTLISVINRYVSLLHLCFLSIFVANPIHIRYALAMTTTARYNGLQTHCVTGTTMIALIIAVSLLFILYVCTIAYFTTRRHTRISPIKASGNYHWLLFVVCLQLSHTLIHTHLGVDRQRQYVLHNNNDNTADIDRHLFNKRSSSSYEMMIKKRNNINYNINKATITSLSVGTVAVFARDWDSNREHWEQHKTKWNNNDR